MWGSVHVTVPTLWTMPEVLVPRSRNPPLRTGRLLHNTPRHAAATDITFIFIMADEAELKIKGAASNLPEVCLRRAHEHTLSGRASSAYHEPRHSSMLQTHGR